MPPLRKINEAGMRIINLTPHDIHIRTETGMYVIPLSGKVARVQNPDAVDCGVIQARQYHIPVRYMDTGNVVGLPPPKTNTIYVVSSIVFEKVANERPDVFTPHGRNRNRWGKVTGCKGLLCSTAFQRGDAIKNMMIMVDT